MSLKLKILCLCGIFVFFAFEEVYSFDDEVVNQTPKPCMDIVLKECDELVEHSGCAEKCSPVFAGSDWDTGEIEYEYKCFGKSTFAQPWFVARPEVGTVFQGARKNTDVDKVVCGVSSQCRCMGQNKNAICFVAGAFIFDEFFHFKGVDSCPDNGADPNLDGDGDGVPDTIDVCPGHDDYVDSDGDGTPDGCDAKPYDSTIQ